MVKPPKKALSEEEKRKRIEALSHAHHSNRLEGDTTTWEETLADPLTQAWLEGALTMEEVIQQRKAQWNAERLAKKE